MRTEVPQSWDPSNLAVRPPDQHGLRNPIKVPHRSLEAMKLHWNSYQKAVGGNKLQKKATADRSIYDSSHCNGIVEAHSILMWKENEKV